DRSSSGDPLRTAPIDIIPTGSSPEVSASVIEAARYFIALAPLGVSSRTATIFPGSTATSRTSASASPKALEIDEKRQIDREFNRIAAAHWPEIIVAPAEIVQQWTCTFEFRRFPTGKAQKVGLSCYEWRASHGAFEED